MKCPNCGAENLDSSQLCFQCGTQLKVQKKKSGIIKKILIVLAVIIGIGMIGDYFKRNNEYVDFVKNGHLYEYSETVSVGRAFENFFADPKWEYGETEYGEKFVNFTGECTYLDKDVTMVIQFILDGDEFYVNAAEMNGVPQSTFMILAILGAVYDEYGA